VCPVLSAMLGDELVDVIAISSCKMLIPCFVGCLPCEPLLTLWSELLGTESTDECRTTSKHRLVYWYLGLWRHLEPELEDAIGNPDDQATVVCCAFMKLGKQVAHDWQPAAGIPCPPASEFARLALAAETRILAEAQAMQLQRKCGIPADLVATLHSEFLKLPGDGAGITLPTLRRVLWSIAPNHIAEKSSEQLFELLDHTGSGSLDFLELMTGVLVLREGSVSRKLELLFSLYDMDGSGYLDKDELLCLAKALQKLSAPKSTVDTSRPRSSLRRLSTTPHPMGAQHIQVKRQLSLRATSDEVTQLGSAEHFRRRLLLLDTSGTGRVSMGDFLQGMPCDELLGRCLMQVGARITEETARHPLLQKLTYEFSEVEDISTEDNIVGIQCHGCWVSCMGKESQTVC